MHFQYIGKKIYWSYNPYWYACVCTLSVSDHVWVSVCLRACVCACIRTCTRVHLCVCACIRVCTKYNVLSELQFICLSMH